MNITGIRPQIGGLTPDLKTGTTGQPAAPATEQITKTFGEVLDGLSASESNTNNLIQRMAAGEDVDIHDVMIASEETDINFRVAMGIRDKLVDAYREVMRMAI